jgi:hypothetical protein
LTHLFGIKPWEMGRVRPYELETMTRAVEQLGAR